MAKKVSASDLLSKRQSRPESPASDGPLPATSTSSKAGDKLIKWLVGAEPSHKSWANREINSMKMDGIEGLSPSDVVRLALNRLRADVDAGRVDLRAELIEQAHEEAGRFPGRKFRGMPPRP